MVIYRKVMVAVFILLKALMKLFVLVISYWHMY